MNPEHLDKLRIPESEKKRSKNTVWAILMAVVLLTGVGLFLARPRDGEERRIMQGNKTQASAQAPPETNVAVAATNRPPAASDAVLTVSGYIIVRERIELSPRFMGVVKWIGVKTGDTVTNGQVVVLLDDAEYQARLKEAEGRAAQALADLTKAELDYQRITQLSTDRVESKQAEDDARLRLAAAQAALKAVQGQVELVKTYLDWTVIRSPLNGVVLEKLVDPNELVVPQSFGGTRGPSTALIALADPKDLQVEIDLNESDLGKVFLNQECRVSPEAYPEKSYSGYVAEIAPQANRQKGTLQIKVQIREPDHWLTPELSAKVDFLPGAKSLEPKQTSEKK